ncbi:MAG: HAMP domain-containing protein, partial [Gemmatimonadetes bacterium]|nr:HAMP domain-containing protein [Gemmatimonadota bacterium]
GDAWGAEEEYQILAFVGGNLVRTSDDRPAVIGRPEGDRADRIRETGKLWTRERNENGTFRVFYQFDRTGPRERIVAFALSDWRAARHIRSLIDIVLKNALFAALLTALLIPVALLSRGRGRLRFEATFQDKLVLALLATALLPALLLGGTGRRMVGQYVLDAGEKEARAALESVRYAIEQEIVREAEDLAATTFVRRRVLGLADEGVIDLEVGLKRFAIYRPDGELLLQNGRVGDLDRETLAIVSERLVPAAAVEQEGGLSLTALVPITLEGFEDRLEGVLQLTRPLEDSWVVTLGEALGRDVSFFSAAHLIASTRGELYRAGLLLPEPPAEAFVPLMYGGESSRIVRQDVAGKPYLVGYGALREFQNRPVGMLGVPLLFREREAATDLARAYDAITYLTFLTLLVVIFAAEFIGQRIARPVADLSDGVRRIASGDLDFSIRNRGGGEIGRLVDSFNGMTGELKRSRESLTERSRFIETILQSVAAGVIAVDRDGRIVSANPAAERFMKEHGQEFEETLGGAFASLVNPPAGRGKKSPAGRAFREEELEVPTRDGRITLRVVASALTDHEGREIGQVIVFEDLTSLIQSKKLVAWGEMARQVAHEIKNPLTPIKLSAQQIRRAYHDKHRRFDQILDESTDLIIEEIEALRRIATEFSTFARMPKRKIEAVAVGALMSEVGRLYEEALTEGELHTVLPADPDLTIRVDREEMRRVLINLLENAVQAAGTDGTIELKGEIVKGSSANDAGWEIWETTLDRPGAETPPIAQNADNIVFTVRDNGPGVSETARGKLFEPNFSTKTNGTGLGLAISRSIVEGYGGSIAIGSTRGVGTVVYVSIPGETPSPDGRGDGNADV